MPIIEESMYFCFKSNSNFQILLEDSVEKVKQEGG